ncbi:MAG TPA: TlyA family RNA methyltransferase, partial [Terrimesophilobacter sp.]|nr:TlyA family RNA methyltransferase [Terrimesophilobacter sp.]
EQLAPAIRAAQNVVVIEGANARFLTRDVLAEAGVDETPTLVVADLSFISLGLVLPALVGTVGVDADFVVLIKPQFEVGRGGVREGIVRDPALREDAVTGVLWSAWDVGLPTAGVISSPIAGGSGNLEYLAWFSTEVGSNPTEWTEQVSALTRN